MANAELIEVILRKKKNLKLNLINIKKCRFRAPLGAQGDPPY